MEIDFMENYAIKPNEALSNNALTFGLEVQIKEVKELN